MAPQDKAAPLSVLPCPKCGGRALVAFDLKRVDLWGRIHCSRCDYSTKDRTYRDAKAEWNGARPADHPVFHLVGRSPDDKAKR